MKADRSSLKVLLVQNECPKIAGITNWRVICAYRSVTFMVIGCICTFECNCLFVIKNTPPLLIKYIEVLPTAILCYVNCE